LSYPAPVRVGLAVGVALDDDVVPAAHFRGDDRGCARSRRAALLPLSKKLDCDS
jgi:hypothetical protein